MASKDEEKGTLEPAMAPPGYKKTSEEAKGAPADAHGGTKQGPKNEKQANMDPTGIKKIKKGVKKEST